jgi:hypothetical protein
MKVMGMGRCSEVKIGNGKYGQYAYFKFNDEGVSFSSTYNAPKGVDIDLKDGDFVAVEGFFKSRKFTNKEGKEITFANLVAEKMFKLDVSIGTGADYDEERVAPKSNITKDNIPF